MLKQIIKEVPQCSPKNCVMFISESSLTSFFLRTRPQPQLSLPLVLTNIKCICLKGTITTHKSSNVI